MIKINGYHQELLIHQQKKEELIEAIKVLKGDIKQLRILIKDHSIQSSMHSHLDRDK